MNPDEPRLEGVFKPPQVSLWNKVVAHQQSLCLPPNDMRISWAIMPVPALPYGPLTAVGGQRPNGVQYHSRAALQMVQQRPNFVMRSTTGSRVGCLARMIAPIAPSSRPSTSRCRNISAE